MSVPQPSHSRVPSTGTGTGASTSPPSPSKPVVIGVYGIPGAGKSFLLDELKKKAQDGPDHFSFYEGSLVIASLVPGGLEAFQQLPEHRKTDYRRAAINAKEAGFDGVEIHAANGYLIDQFLRTGTNRRTDDYGGLASNRARFLMEAVEQVLEVWDSKQVGVRISPTVDFNDMRDDNPLDTFSVAVGKLNDFGLG